MDSTNNTSENNAPTSKKQAENEIFLYETHQPLVHYIINKYALFNKYKNQFYDDLFQEGSIGLLRAIRTFDPNRSIAFSTYASKAIYNTMVQHILTFEFTSFKTPPTLLRAATKIKRHLLTHPDTPSEELQRLFDLSDFDISTILTILKSNVSLEGVQYSVSKKMKGQESDDLAFDVEDKTATHAFNLVEDNINTSLGFNIRGKLNQFISLLRQGHLTNNTSYAKSNSVFLDKIQLPTEQEQVSISLFAEYINLILADTFLPINALYKAHDKPRAAVERTINKYTKLFKIYVHETTTHTELDSLFLNSN